MHKNSLLEQIALLENTQKSPLRALSLFGHTLYFSYMPLTLTLPSSQCSYPGRAPKCSDDGINARQLLPLLSKLFCISKLRDHKYNSIAVQNSNSEHVRYRPSLLAVPNSTSSRASKVSTFAARLPRLDSPSSSSSPSGQIDRGRLLLLYWDLRAHLVNYKGEKGREGWKVTHLWA